MFGHKGELGLPAAAKADKQAREVARVWATGQVQQIVLRADAWDDPAEWGILLADLARHVAGAYEQHAGRPPAETLDRIRRAFEAEWETPTDEPTRTIGRG